MGQWNTLHTFDEKLYQTKTLRLLENEQALLPYFQAYKSISLPGTCKFTPADFVRYAAEFRQQISDLFVVGIANADDPRLPLPADDEYTFVSLFTYLIFHTAARYDPYFRLGYRSFSSSILFRKRESVARQIISDLLNSGNGFNRDGYGIRKILSAVDVKLLMLDLDNLTAKTDEGSAEYVEDFKQYVRYLAERDLGMLSGQDLPQENLMRVDSELPDMRELKIESLSYE